jgi:hypothetical protein
MREQSSAGVGGPLGRQQQQEDQRDNGKEKSQDKPANSVPTLALSDVVDPDHDQDPDDEANDAPESGSGVS